MIGSVAWSGTFADRYVLKGELGNGATALVYRARDLQRGHDVAIKFLRPELAQSVGADRFLKEIRLTQQLHHPHIVPLLESGKVGEQLYFVLPAMEEGTLRTRLRREKQLRIDEAVAIARQVAYALDYAHQRNVIHRDVKPENILFTGGQACLADFGIARALERALDETTTSTSVVRGTPPYMSPEQASGEKELDGRSDQYALACVLYEMLAGMQPFVGPTPQSVIAQRLSHPPRPLRVYRASVSPALEAVVMRALSVTPADRFPSAAHFADALAAASSRSAAESSTPPGRSGRGWTYTGFAFVGLCALVLAALTSTDDPAWPAIPEGDRRRIAVLYFDVQTPDAIPTHIANGLSEDLIDQLGSLGVLHVTSAAGVRQFREGAVSVDSIGRALKVGTLVTGTLTRIRDTVRVAVRLVDAATGRQLFSSVVQSHGRNLFALQDSLSDRVAFLLRQRIGVEIALSDSRRGARSLQAWELVQLANAELQLAQSAGARRDAQAVRSYARADSLLARAERLDPQWIHPRVKRARVAMALANAQVIAPPGTDSATYARLTPLQRRGTWLQRAFDLADSAVQHTPSSAEALELRGHARFLLIGSSLADDSLAGFAKADLRNALNLRPDAANAWATLAQLLYAEGRFQDAAVAARRAFDADAFFETRRTMAVAGNASLYAENFDDARRWCRMGLAHYPDDPRFTECELALLGWTGRGRRDVAAAWRTLHEIESRDSGQVLRPSWALRRLYVAAVLARSGMQDSARALLRLVSEREGGDRARRSALPAEAYVHVLLNEPDQAIDALRAFLSRIPGMQEQVALHPWFRPLASDPRFAALTRRSSGSRQSVDRGVQ